MTFSNPLDAAKIAQAFSLSATTYDSVSVLQREVGERLLERLEIIRITPHAIMDLGSGTGYFTTLLEKNYKKAAIYSVDRAKGMLQFAKKRKAWLSHQRFIQADAVRLPFPNQCMDLIFSNLVLHWCSDLKAVFQEMYRVLKPGGFAIFSLMGPDTLKELRDSWKKVDGHPHVNTFMDMHHMGDLLLQTGWSDPVMDMEYLSLRYGNLGALFNDLRKLGSHNNFAGKRLTLTGKTRFKQMVEQYETYRAEGLLPATYEIIYGHAWRPLESEEAHLGDDVVIPVNRIRKF
jgi:malonyl-CoA O-methyltransferase